MDLALASFIKTLVESNASVVGVLLLALGIAVWVCKKLWDQLSTSVTTRINTLESSLDACEDRHKACEKKNHTLADALFDSIQGRSEEALAKVHQVLNAPPDS